MGKKRISASDWLTIAEYAKEAEITLSQAWLRFMQWEYDKVVAGDTVKGGFKYPRLLFKRRAGLPLNMPVAEVMSVLTPIGVANALKWIRKKHPRLENKTPLASIPGRKPEIIHLAKLHVAATQARLAKNALDTPLDEEDEEPI